MARLQAHLRLAHLAFDLGTGHERRHRVDHHDIHAARAHEHFDDFKRLFTVVRLRHEEVVQFDPEFLRVRRIQRVLSVDEGRHAAQFLGFRNQLQGERGLA
jgi:hypothetical protein